jgi:hypothetical protein
MTAKEYMREVASLGCLICEEQGTKDVPSEVHHAFSAEDRSDWLVVPLCPEHHRGASGVHGLHRRTFEMRYRMSDARLLAATLARVHKVL